MSFWESSFLWLDATIAAVTVAAVCAWVGVYTVLRRVVFLPAALSQISGLGVVLAFFVSIHTAHLGGEISPQLTSTAFTLVGALLLGWMPSSTRLSKEGIIGIAYIVASALIVIIGDRIPEESHQVHDILFGNAVVVERRQMITTVISSGVILLLHTVMFRAFLFTSFDRETAKAHGVRVRLTDSILFMSMGFVISEATKTIGALPVFAFAVLPGASALLLLKKTWHIFVGASVMASFSAFGGYYLSFIWQLPTGACMVTLQGGCLLTSYLARNLTNRKRYETQPASFRSA